VALVNGLAVWLFARLFRGHSLYWAFGALGLLVGGHLTWFALGGAAGESPRSGSDRLVVAGAALVGMFLGFSAAQPIGGRRTRRLQAEPGTTAGRPRA
jgi:hypothetical protein